jgi:hypothetical protein
VALALWACGFLGALIAAFLIGRIFMWLLRGMGDRPLRPALSYSAGGTLVVVVYGFANADAGGWNPTKAGIIFLIAAAVWLIVEIFRQHARRPA